MAPVALLLVGFTLSATYIVNAADYKKGQNEVKNSDLHTQAQSKQSLRDIGDHQRYRTNSQTQYRRPPEIPSLYTPGLRSKMKQDALYNVQSIQQGKTRIDLLWGPWSPWSLCSRSCGGGVAKRYRRCGRSRAVACEGPALDYILCNTMDCPSGTPSFREQQCAEHSKRVMQGRLGKYLWFPYSSDGSQSCQLYCTAKQVRFIQPFGLAIDGTKCGEDEENICIGGKCVEVGCDMVVGSRTMVDACGVCGGNNSTCFHYHNKYAQLPDVVEYFNYNEIARIPIGASNIFVTDYSENFLALMEADDHFEQYVVNGNRILSWPGRYEISGTSVIYSRTNDNETFEIKGPTKKDLYIMILYLGREPDIKYEYWIPQSQRTDQLQEAPTWYATDYGDYYYGGLLSPQYSYETATSPQQVQATTTATTTTTPNLPRTTTQTTTKTTTISTFPYSSTIAPPSNLTREDNHTDSTQSKKPSKRCKKCKKPKNRKLSYCKGDFAIHARILSKQRFRHGKSVRYDVEVRTTYKTDFKVMSREYIWVPSTCCPKLRPLREYLLIGRKVNVDVTDEDGGGKPGKNPSRERRYQARLIVDGTDYWASWKKSYERSMSKISNRLQCTKFLRRQSRLQRMTDATKLKHGRPH